MRLLLAEDLKSSKAPVLLGKINFEKLLSGSDSCELLQIKEENQIFIFQYHYIQEMQDI